ncbi:MAG: hypothetical protein OXG98_14215 [Gemmatimonadetes bacterium]|nr:hypothetical protein [Gemmatimonadota bacterium]
MSDVKQPACDSALALGSTRLASTSSEVTFTVALWRLYGITEEERTKGNGGLKEEGEQFFRG